MIIRLYKDNIETSRGHIGVNFFQLFTRQEIEKYDIIANQEFKNIDVTHYLITSSDWKIFLKIQDQFLKYKIDDEIAMLFEISENDLALEFLKI